MPVLQVRGWFGRILILAAAIFGMAEGAQAQWMKDVETTAAARATGLERAAQSDLWVLEVNYKPLRMIEVEITDPQTGERKKELVWYLVYRAVNRPIEHHNGDVDTIPMNDEDPPLGPPMFVPQFILMTEDNHSQQIYQDEVLPEAQAVINKRERAQYKNSVEVVGPVPAVSDKEPRPNNALYGVVTWRGIDPETDRFTVFMSGFSNGYKMIDVDGKKEVLRKTLMQKYWRPGDEIDERETEIRPDSDPQWIYR